MSSRFPELPSLCPGYSTGVIYGDPTGSRKAGAEHWLARREEASLLAMQLLNNPDMELPTGEPFVPNGTVVEPTGAQHQLENFFSGNEATFNFGVENIGKTRSDDATETVILQSPHRVFAR